MKPQHSFVNLLFAASLATMLDVGITHSQGAAGQTVASPSTHPEPKRMHGWSWKLPPDLVKPDCGKRNPVFYVGEPVTFKLGPAAVSYEVRDYWGNLVDQGKAGADISVKPQPPGWYKLYVYGKGQEPEPATAKPGPDKAGATPPLDRSLWADIVGGTTFVVFRNNPNFPPLPPKDKYVGPGTGDEVMRGVSGMGPQRHSAYAAKPEESIKNLEPQILADRALYLPHDPLRKRALMIAFPDGTKGHLDGVKQIVEHFKNDVKYYEPRNEPNYGSSGADFVKNEMADFYATVKSVDPSLQVLGPGTVAIDPQLQAWIEDFLKAGGTNYIDAFSFHCYNGVSGDYPLGRRSMDTLTALLKKYGADKKELWQTEQGYFAAVYGAYQPRLQGRWTMLEMMLFEQYDLPKEHNHLWYDVSHGFWDVPTWWENEDGGFNPALPLMRVYAEEVYGTNFKKPFDFGDTGNKLYLGSLFEGPDKSVAVFMSAGSTDGKVELKVSGGQKLHLVSAFGVEQDLAVHDGRITLPVPELPVWVELAKGQTIEVVPTDWGTNLARAVGVTAAASIKPDTEPGKKAAENLPLLYNGEMESWYWQHKGGPWRMGHGEFPCWVEMRLPTPTSISRVVVYAAPPWQSQGSLLDYELQYDQNGKWVTLEHVQEPAKTFGVFTPATRTSVDSFYSERWIFRHEFKPVTTGKIRLLIHDATCGGGATKIVGEAGGQTWGQEVVLREIEIYAK